MKVFLTGATGFVGNQILRDLIEAEHTVKALVREGSESKLPVNPEQLEIVQGDALDKSSYHGSLSDCDAVINLIGIIREFPKQGINFERMHVRTTQFLVETALAEGVDRYVQMSALGVSHDSDSKYFTTKARAEDMIRASGLKHTIIRPSLIFGPGDEFINYFADIIRKFHTIPVIGHGKYRMEPVYIKDVSKAFVQSLDKPETINQTFEMGGPERFEYEEMMHTVKKALGTWALTIHYPKSLMMTLAGILQYYKFFPLTTDQIIQLFEENITDDDSVYQVYDIQPTPFEETINGYLNKET
jgi:NADH dehydrogenase